MIPAQSRVEVEFNVWCAINLPSKRGVTSFLRGTPFPKGHLGEKKKKERSGGEAIAWAPMRASTRDPGSSVRSTGVAPAKMLQVVSCCCCSSFISSPRALSSLFVTGSKHRYTPTHTHETSHYLHARELRCVSLCDCGTAALLINIPPRTTKSCLVFNTTTGPFTTATPRLRILFSSF